MLCTRRYEVHRALAKRKLLPLDIEDAPPFENDVNLVVGVRLLTVGLGSDQDVDPDLQSRGAVDDLVAPAGGLEALLDVEDTLVIHAAST